MVAEDPGPSADEQRRAAVKLLGAMSRGDVLRFGLNNDEARAVLYFWYALSGKDEDKGE